MSGDSMLDEARRLRRGRMDMVLRRELAAVEDALARIIVNHGRGAHAIAASELSSIAGSVFRALSAASSLATLDELDEIKEST